MRDLQGASKPGEDVRAVGSDITAGQVVLQAGDLLGAAEIGILATVGAARVKVGQHQQLDPHLGGTLMQSSAGDVDTGRPFSGDRSYLMKPFPAHDDLDTCTASLDPEQPVQSVSEMFL